MNKKTDDNDGIFEKQTEVNNNNNNIELNWKIEKKKKLYVK